MFHPFEIITAQMKIVEMAESMTPLDGSKLDNYIETKSYLAPNGPYKSHSKEIHIRELEFINSGYV